MEVEIIAHLILYGLLVFLGILGNILILVTILATTVENHGLAASDIILSNLAAVNLLLSTSRNILLFITESGVNILLTLNWCRIFMFLWVWLKSVSVWVTFCLSCFHFLKIKQHVHLSTKRKEIIYVLVILLAVWFVNFLYAVPAFVYSHAVSGNETKILMVVSTTTDPFLGCAWKFPTRESGIMFAVFTLVLHELIPILLMVGTNLSTVYYLSKHIRAIADEHLHSVQVERTAAKLILALVTLFVLCTLTHMLAVGYYNHNAGPSTAFLLTLARYFASLFIGFSPLLIAAGHSKLRNKVCKVLHIKII
ncbi:olfactory receptor class A-like protein 4 [Hemiscyllium ocellatum]|uniref:olfactory receptor class A-like protein 4 n=1 Tax=Hemiscyllium ocellatum TaxID=170820 RepID=UPI002965ECB8|nr:olfactory receptor class A-like protein 4 [Hemiscyllium ocellatum]